MTPGDKLADRLGQIIFRMECRVVVLKNHVVNRATVPADEQVLAEMQADLEKLKEMKDDMAGLQYVSGVTVLRKA